MHIFTLDHSLGCSCNCARAMTLDVNSTIWNLESWGRPYRFVSPLLDRLSQEKMPIQIECGSSFSAVLTRSGDVYAWLESALQYKKPAARLATKAVVPDGGTVIPCHTWEVNVDPVKLLMPLYLPDLPMTGLPEEERRKETKLIKIAACNTSLVGLTNKGHVLKVDGLISEEDNIWVWGYVSKNTRIIWCSFLNRDMQLPNYSEIDKVKTHPAFHKTKGNDGEERPPQVELSLDTMLITQVSYIVSMNSQPRI